MIRVRAAGVAAILSLSGCAYPTTNITQGEVQGWLQFRNMPEAAEVTVDGRQMGKTSQYGPSKSPLRVSGGAHRVSVTLGSQILLDRTVYVDEAAHVTLEPGH